MASKIYKKGVFLVIEDTVSGNLKEFNTADVQIVKRNASLDVYEVLVLGVSQLKVNLADIQNEVGSAYSENDWDVFRFNEVGVVNTSNTSTVTTTTVDISSAQILSMGTTPIELLPVLPALSYYDIDSILLEYTFDSTNYTIAEPLYAFFGNAEYFTISERIINGNASVLKARVAGVIDQDLVATGTGAFINMDIDVNVGGDTSLLLTTWNNTDPTLGDGTLRAIITYTTRTFGA